MVQRYEVRGKELGGDEFYSDWVEVVKYEDYAALREAAAALLSEAAKVYKDYNETIAPDFVDMQTLQELADLL